MSGKPVFAFAKEAEQFDAAFHRKLAESVLAMTRKYLPARNTLIYNHGRSWQYAHDEHEPATMHSHSAEMVFRFEDIAQGKDTILWDQIRAATEAYHSQFLAMLHGTVFDASERSGNVVSQKEHGGFPRAFLEMLRKIEFGVDRNGKVTLPEMHLPAGVAKDAIMQLEAQPEAFRAEVDAIKKAKTIEALRREEERLAKFRDRE